MNAINLLHSRPPEEVRLPLDSTGKKRFIWKSIGFLHQSSD